MEHSASFFLALRGAASCSDGIAAEMLNAAKAVGGDRLR